MRNEKKIIIASGLGFLAATGLFFLSRLLRSRGRYEEAYYEDHHYHFPEPKAMEEHHGVEYLALR